MTAAGDNLDRIEANARQYLTTPDYPDGWIEPHEITDAASPDLILARDVLALVEVARAAQEYLEHTETSDFRRGHTNTACPPLTRAMCKPYMRLRAALARLDTKERT